MTFNSSARFCSNIGVKKDKDITITDYINNVKYTIFDGEKINKDDILKLVIKINYLARDVTNLQCENEKLKQQKAEFMKVIGCYNCIFHNYDWFEDGEEFEVCDKGNEDGLYNGFCSKWEEL